MVDGLMAKKKASERSAKNKERKEPGFKTVGIRSSDAYAEWLNALAKHDHRSIAALVEHAVARYAKEIGFTRDQPERIP